MKFNVHVCLAAFLLSVQWTRVARTQPSSDAMVQPTPSSEGIPMSGAVASEPSLSALPSTASPSVAVSLQGQQQPSSAAGLTMSSMVLNASSTALMPTSSSTALSSASPSPGDPPITTVTSNDISSSSQMASSSPSPSASAVPPASLLTGSITSNNLTEQFVGSMCSCDLHVTSCDINCCCDADCSTEELQTFTMCLDIPPDSNNPVCVSNDFFVQSLTSFRTERVTRDNTQLLCVFIDNYPGRTMLSPPPSVSQSNIASVVQSNLQPGDTLTSRSSFPYGPFYKVGDPLLSVYNSSTLDTWTLPSSLNSAFCNAMTAVGYLQPLSSNCRINIADGVTSLCGTSSPFNANRYIQHYGLLQLPLEVLTNVSMVVPVTVSGVTCVTVGGTTRDCGGGALPPDPVLGEGLCQNVLNELTFTVYHHGNQGVRSISVDVVLVDVSTTTTDVTLEQQLAVNFQLFNQSGDVPLVRSGVGGYQTGSPLVAGQLVQGESSFVNVSVSPSDWFTVRSGGQVQCQGLTAVSINFTQDVQTACFLSLLETESCQQLQERALGALTPWGMSVSHVGRMGDPDPFIISEWVPIVNNGVEDSTMVGGTLCDNIPVGVSIQIVHSATGSTSSPSSQVLGVLVSYVAERVCLGTSCGPIPKPILLQTSVTFLDLTQPPVEALRSISDVRGQLPEDFYYPFFVANSALSLQLCGIVFSSCLVLTLLVV